MTFPNARLVRDLFLNYFFFILPQVTTLIEIRKHLYLVEFFTCRMLHTELELVRIRTGGRRLLPKYSAIFRHPSRYRFIRIRLFSGIFQVIVEGLPGVLGNKGTLAKYRREQRNISQFLGTREQNSKNYSTKKF